MTTTNTREPQEGLRRHKLMTKEVASTLPELGAQDGKGGEAVAYLKLFCPYGRYTLYVTEYDGEDTLFGYCISPLGPDCDEYGYSSLQELAETTVALFGRVEVPAIERDCHWAARPLSECKGVDA